MLTRMLGQGVHALPVENLSISHNGMSCLTVGGGEAFLWDTPTGVSTSLLLCCYQVLRLCCYQVLRGKFGEGSEYGHVSVSYGPTRVLCDVQHCYSVACAPRHQYYPPSAECEM
eukprot:647740-Rhodomonas_salina.1